MTGIKTSHCQILETQERRQLEISSASFFVLKNASPIFGCEPVILPIYLTIFSKAKFCLKKIARINFWISTFSTFTINMTRISHVHGELFADVPNAKK